jgi:CRISPR-associated protein Csd1
MLLQRLNEYADRLDLPPTLYTEVPVRYLVELDRAGRLLLPEPVDTADPSNQRTRRGQPRPMPQIRRAVAIRPLLLADNAEYTLGLAREASKPARVAACHAAYMELVGRCAVETGAPELHAVMDFLAAAPADRLQLSEDFDRSATITFRVDDVFPTDLPAVQAFWAAEHGVEEAGERVPVMQCVACGKQRPVRARLTGALKRVPGGQTSGTSLISANEPAFESYGLEASLVAPTCTRCGERFTKAANALLADEKSSIRLGGAAFLFWTREPGVFSIRDFLDRPQPEQVHRLMETALLGGPGPPVDETAFYATVLSGSGGRAVVRDWLDTTVGAVKQSLARWFALQQIVGPDSAEWRPFGVYELAAATVRDARTDLSPVVPSALIRTALTSVPVPYGLLYQAVRRDRAEQRVTRARAALIKLVLTSHDRNGREDAMVQLEPGHPSPAYHCGRLLAVLESVQRLAVPGIKATVVDRFFGTAGTAPASVFGRLVRGAQPHLAKLERDRPSAYWALQRRLEEVHGALASYPRTLALEEQGLFALGYYHQRAFDREQARIARERKAANKTPPADGAILVEALTDEEEI